MYNEMKINGVVPEHWPTHCLETGMNTIVGGGFLWGSGADGALRTLCTERHEATKTATSCALIQYFLLGSVYGG